MTSLQAQQALMLPVAALRTTRREHLMEQDRRTLKILQGKKEKTPNQALRNPKRKQMRYHSLISTITQVCLKLLLFTYPSVCSLVTLRQILCTKKPAEKERVEPTRQRQIEAVNKSLTDITQRVQDGRQLKITRAIGNCLVRTLRNVFEQTDTSCKDGLFAIYSVEI